MALGLSLLEVNGRKYGAFQSRHDYRDWTLPFRARAIQTPSTVDLTQWHGPIKDQGKLGSCTGHGASACQEFLVRKYGKVADGADAPVFSPLFIYWNERNRENSVNEDSGAQIRTAADVLVEDGVCLESEDPYQPINFKVAPTPQQVAEAARWKGGGYHRLNGLSDMKCCIASGYPFLLGFSVYESFEDVGADGLMAMPKHGEAFLGGHCILAGLGYDDSKKTVTCQNSWGTGWARGGLFDMPFEFISDPKLAFDAFVVHFGKW